MSATPTGPHGGADTPINLWNLGRVRILQALTQRRSLSRAELVQRTGLARATVGSVVYDLIEAGIVRESANTGPTGARTGRPPQMLSLAPEAGYAIGIDVGHDHVRATLTDLVGAPQWDRSVGIAVDDDPEHALRTAVQLIEAAIAETEVDRGKILGIGLGIACPVDASTGELHAEDIMAGWVGVRPTDELADRTGLAVQIINDANAGALAERRFGAARDVANVVYLRLSSGIGAGVVCDGRMLLGHDGLAGELGHVTVEPQGTLCRCGNRGCLETVASPTAIAEQLSRGRGEPVHDIDALLAAGDRGTLRAIEDAGEAVGRALAMTVMLLNPELIVVGGDLVSAGEALFEPMRRTISRTIMRSQQNSLRIVPGALGDSAGVLGAAALVLDTVPERLGVAD
ncbi:MAG TPA: ROK family transcriptional regulator [Pseudonocardiaceae bacterium]|nr:ROK family transcriptional regulator [Pseudonocardiaceae bacterium]